jgi:hypothetical protein
MDTGTGLMTAPGSSASSSSALRVRGEYMLRGGGGGGGGGGVCLGGSTTFRVLPRALSNITLCLGEGDGDGDGLASLV